MSDGNATSDAASEAIQEIETCLVLQSAEVAERIEGMRPRTDREREARARVIVGLALRRGDDVAELLAADQLTAKQRRREPAPCAS